MPKYVHPDIFEDGAGSVAARVSRAILVASFSTVYADVVGSLKVAEAAIDSADVTVGAGVPANSIAIEVATAALAAGNALIDVPDGTTLHIAIVDDTADVVLLECEEDTDQDILAGNPITFTADVVYTMEQPA